MMSKIQVLDCTLRDGGYCNNCKFGFDNEKKIVHGLVEPTSILLNVASL